MSDRKYRHQGYQDSGAGKKSSSTSTPSTPYEPQRQRLEGSPRGRTAGGFGPEAFKCNRCGELQNMFGDLTPESACGKCSADLHTCGNCRFFDTTTLWECRENITARVSAKHDRNECAHFSPRIVRDLAAGKSKSAAPDDSRRAFDALFDKK
jgi:hypothetical protein